MARLPNPGGDQGQWGQILNDYLAQVHNADGSLKNGIIAKEKLSTSVQASLDNADAAVSGSVPDANASTKGKIQLTGDLTGTAASPALATAAVSTAKLADGAVTDAKLAGSISQSKITNLTTDLADKASASHTHAITDVTNLQTTLSGKADTTHAHAAADITSGTIATARLGSGVASSATFLRGDNTWATPAGGGGGTGPTIVALGDTVSLRSVDIANSPLVVVTLTLTGAAELSFTNVPSLCEVRLVILQDATGGRMLVLGGVDVPLALAANAPSTVDLTTADGGTTWYISGQKGDQGVGIPAGGALGARLVKASATDFDFAWKTKGEIQTYWVSAPQLITNSTTLVTVTGLEIPVGVGEAWHIEGRLVLQGNATGDYKFGFTFAAGLKAYWGLTMNSAGIRSFGYAGSTSAPNGPGDETGGVINGGLGAGVGVVPWEVIAWGNTGGGNVTLQVAQLAADATSLQILPGTFAKATRIS